MSNTGGMLDAYLIAQALGWEWNFWTMINISFAPILIIGGAIFFIFFVLPFLLEICEDIELTRRVIEKNFTMDISLKKR